MTSRCRSRSRCKIAKVSRSWSRSGCNHYTVHLTKLNGDNCSYQLPLTVGQIKAKLPKLPANSTYDIINDTTVLEDAYYVDGADYHLNVVIVKQQASSCHCSSDKGASDTGLHWVPIELSTRYRPLPNYRQEICTDGYQTYKLVSNEKAGCFTMGCCMLIVLLMMLLMWLLFMVLLMWFGLM